MRWLLGRCTVYIYMYVLTFGRGFSTIIFKAVKVKQSHYRPGQALRVHRRLRLPDFKTIGTRR